MKNILISFLFFVFLFCNNYDGVLVVVGDNMVTKSDFEAQLYNLAAQRGVSPSLTPLKYDRLKKLLLEDVIDRYVFLEHAKKDSNITISSDEVQVQLDGQIDMFLNKVGNSVDSLEAIFGQPLQQIKADYWDEIYNAMLIERYKFFLTSSLSVGKREVEVFYNEYKDSLPPSPANANFSILNLFFEPSNKTISSSFEFVSSLRDSVEKNFVTFSKIIERHSDDFASLSSDGKIGSTERGSLFPEYEEAAFSMKKNSLVGPIKTEAGHHLIKLLEKRGNKIDTQHLLKIIVPTEEDKQLTIEEINMNYNKSKKNPLFLENLIEELPLNATSLSGNYNNFPLRRLPEDLYSIIKKSGDSILYEPMFIQNGSLVLLYVYEVFEEEKATLQNSYAFIESIALDKKSIEFLNGWLDTHKPNTHINILN